MRAPCAYATLYNLTLALDLSLSLSLSPNLTLTRGHAGTVRQR